MKPSEIFPASSETFRSSQSATREEMQGLPQKLGHAAMLVILPHQVSQHGQLPLILETGCSPYFEKKL